MPKIDLGNIQGPKGEKGDKGDTGEVSVVSKNDGITINGNDIQLNTVDNLINTSITKPLSANQGVILDKQDKGVLGGYNGIFPLTVASKNGIYLLPATNKFYVCVENYSGSSLTAPNANFEELSVFQNRNKLENLCAFTVVTLDENDVKNHISKSIPYPIGYTPYNSKVIIQALGDDTVSSSVFKINEDYTYFKAFGNAWFNVLIIFIKSTS